MLASVALVGCTDEFDEGGSTQAIQKEAYISLSINSNTDSSRAAGKGYGDEDGSTESSGHTTQAQRTENNVNSLLVVVTPKTLGEEGVNPVVDEKPTINGFVRHLTAGQFVASGENITMNAIERVDYLQEYKVLVVVNPVSGLLTSSELQAAISNQNHASAYTFIRNYKGLGYEDIDATAAVNYSFMMSNQSEEYVNPTVENQIETNPAKAEIEVERAVSKITYRPSGANLDNTFPITVEIKNYKAETERFWFVENYTEKIDGNDVNVKKYTYALFNKATYGTGTSAQEVWVLLKEANKKYDGGQIVASDIRGIFQKEYKTVDNQQKLVEYTGFVTPIANEFEKGNKTAALLKDITPVDGDDDDATNEKELQAYLDALKFVVDDVTPEDPELDEYSIQLEKYALTNMSNVVYAVRHTSNTTTWGPLTGDEYIVDPYTTSKVAATGATYTTWFETATLYETIKGHAKAYGDEVAAWNALPTGTGNSEGSVTAHHTDAGQILRYCYENSVLVANTNDNLISGIVFVGQIKKDDVAVPVLYKYNGKFFSTLKQLLVENTNLTISENASETAITDAGIEIYKDGKCYYYVPIKHKDNGVADYAYNAGVKVYDMQGGVGNMEFAIMRNNIYSMAVTGISNIGMSTLELAAGAGVQDESAFISVECNILKWIVRFNDIVL